MKKLTKKIISSIIFSSIIGSPIYSLKADTIDTISRAFSYAVAEDPTKVLSGGDAQINIYKIDKTGAATLVVENLYPDGGPGTFSADQYAIDAAGNPIPIDYTNGTKLLINGRDVEQSINLSLIHI